MRRRDFVIGGLTASIQGVAVPSRALAQSEAVPKIDRLIDAHCHIFNADDLPIEGFVTKIIVPLVARSNELIAKFQQYPGALEALVRALAVQMKEGAPSIKSELQKIDEVDSDQRKKPTAAWRKNEDLKNLRAAFGRIWEKDPSTFRGIRFTQTMALQVAIENIQLLLVQQVEPKFGRGQLTVEERQTLNNWDYKKLAAQLYPRNDLVGTYIRWALLFTRYRFELADALDDVHQLAHKSRVVLMTPASVDFSKWLEDDKHTGMEEQIKVMGRLARRKYGPRIHGFVGFDPLRQALYERGKHRPGEKEPAALLKTAIDGVPTKGSDGSGGALGVKLYPPMGFRATANAELADSRFANPAFLISSDTGIGPQIGAHLDRALSRLYTWCSEKNVPVMAHTTNSFGPSLEYEDRANPQYWGQVLKTHPKLRINMAHFGHFKPAVIGNDVKVHIKECWEWTIGELMAASPDSYAYADISSIAEILKPGPSRKLFDCMRIFKDNFKNSADKLIYGTDWSMIAQTEGFPRAFSDQPYTDLMAKFLHLVGYSKGEIEGIMFRNATRYLGLSKAERAAFGDNCSRGRLEKFYTAQALPAEWMKAFD